MNVHVTRLVSPPKILLNALDQGKVAPVLEHGVVLFPLYTSLFTKCMNWLGFLLGAYLILDGGLEVVCP